MIWHERPGQAGGFRFPEEKRKAFKKKRAVIVIKKDVAFFYTADHHMLQDAGNVNTGSAGHKSGTLLSC